MNAFKTADFYEVLGNTGGRLEREGPFLLEALASAPSKRVADLACGLGLHARFLAEHGAVVDAFDLSREMIEHARTLRAHANITYAVGDMCTPVAANYGMALCLGNSLSLLESREQTQQFFKGVHSALSPGGILVTQTLNYDAPGMKKARIRVERAAFRGGELAAVKRFHPREDHTILSITYLLVSDNGMTDVFEKYTLQHWSAVQLSEWASQEGFTVEGCFGAYDRGAFKHDSSDIILLLRAT